MISEEILNHPAELWAQTLSEIPLFSQLDRTGDLGALDDTSGSHGLSDTSIPDISVISGTDGPSAHSLDIPGTHLGKALETGAFDIAKHTAHSLIAVSNGLLAVCMNARVPRFRVTNLWRWGRCLTDAQDDVDVALSKFEYKEFMTPGVDFVVRRIEFNKNGDLLAVIGDDDIAVISLPRLSWNTKQIQLVSATVIRFPDQFSSPIVKARWHPLSAKGRHLVVLSKDGTIQIFNVLADDRRPEQTFHFKPPVEQLQRPNRDGLFSANMNKDEFASFCFGPQDGKWGTMTLYGVTRGGDVFSLCPVMPDGSAFTIEQLENMAMSNQADKNEDMKKWARGTYTDDMYYWRTEWVKDLLKNARAVETSVLAGEEISLPLPQRSTLLKTKAQGPHRILPVPEPDELFGAATDIICLETEPVAIVIIAFAGGLVRTCYDVDGLKPVWHLNKQPLAEEDVISSLVLHEDIDLGISEITTTSRRTAITLTPDPHYTSAFFCHHSYGVHSISTEPWMRNLKDLVESAPDMGDRLEDELFEHKESDVEWLIRTSDSFTSVGVHDDVIGFATIMETLLGYSYVLLTSTPRLHGDLLPLRLTYTQPVRNDAGDEYYQPILKAPVYEIPEVFYTGTRKLATLPASTSGSMTDITRALENNVQSRMHDLQLRKAALIEIAKRMTAQRQEIIGQLSLLKQYEDAIDNFWIAKYQELEKRSRDLMRRDSISRKKQSIILQILMDETQPLSEAEKKWMKEVAQLHRDFEDRIKPQKEKLQLHKDALIEQRKRWKSQITVLSDAGPLTRPQIERINGTLSYEAQLLARTLERARQLKISAEDVESKLRQALAKRNTA
ncbi:hypothetical protein BC832DRAFT_548477 [Gaertneriomyces semiglobifer]|nr:hypothetical protein BC832DRAFT_548477 [Gaertneriomyces semiglobifer]